MPKTKLSDPERRRLTLAALSGVSPSKLAEEYGVSRSYIYKLRDSARENAKVELEFWRGVSILDTGYVDSSKEQQEDEQYDCYD